jgi:iron complex transport system substrate-binding protein
MFLKIYNQKLQFFLIIIFFFGEGCHYSPEKSTKIHQINKSESAKKNTKVTIKYAKNFKIQYFEKYKVLTVYRPQNNQRDSTNYILISRGEKKPENIDNQQVIETPIGDWIALSHTYIACAKLLQSNEQLIGVNEVDYLPDVELLDKIKNGRVKNVGGGGELNEELIISIKPQLIMTGGAGAFKMYPAMQKSGIKVIYNADWLENTPLGRAEWLKFMAILVEKEELGDSLFNEIEVNYLKTKEIAQKYAQKPLVLCDIPFKSTWYVPGGKSYFAQLLADAQAKYHWADTPNEGSLPLDFEAVYPTALSAKVWINLGINNSKAEILAQDARFSQFKAFKDGELYNYNLKATAKGGNEYFMNGIVTPHLILADLVKILHPDLLPNHKFVYYKKIK